MNKNKLQNDHLLQNLKREAWADDVVDSLKQANVTTYKQLFALIRDKKADANLRADICDEIRRLFSWIDKRRFVPPLLDALKTANEALLQNAIQALGSLESKHAVAPIINLACDKTQSYETRRFAILALRDIGDKKAVSALISIMFDRGDNLKIREDAIEQTAWFVDPSLAPNYAKLLSDPEPDMRFWAAYGLAVMRTDISAALSEVDRVAAFDHIAPLGWWHVDRESFDALENIYWMRLGLDATQRWHKAMYLISPAPEYLTFEWLFNRRSEKEHKAVLPPNLKVEPDWLAGNIRKEWSNVKLNIREPRPQTYLLDWFIEIDNKPLIGGLHRDQYAVVITGGEKSVQAFAAWYRSMIEPEQHLFLYEWAGLAVELKTEMSVTDVEKAQREREKDMSARYEQTLKYPWTTETS